MAGAGYKLFNTGDVLTAAQVNTYLMEQTVMVFANAAARTTALSGVVSEGMISYLKDTNAVEVYDGSNWVSSDDPNAIQNTIVDAKGDLITATAADTPSRIAVGNNGETLVADSSATTGLRWQGAQAAGKNYLINGSLDFWQRGTTFNSSAGYTADRWVVYTTAGTVNASRSTDVPTSPYFTYSISMAGSTSTADILRQRIESGVATPLAGKTVTLSFWAKSTSGTAGLKLTTQTADATDNFTNVTTDIGAAIISASVASSWTRYSCTFTVSTGAVRGYQLLIYRDSSSSSNTTLITGVQLEFGSVATEFTRATGTLAGELAACQRYYWRQYADTNNTYMPFGNGVVTTSTNAYCFISNPVPMRIAPSTIDFSTLAFNNYGLTVYAVSTLTATANRGGNLGQLVTIGSTGMTAGQGGWLTSNNSSSGYIGFSAEL